jgi:hypothetical protein
VSITWFRLYSKLLVIFGYRHGNGWTDMGCKHETVLEKYIPTVNVDPSKIQSLIILSLICTSLSCGTVVVFISLITTSLLVTSLPE